MENFIFRAVYKVNVFFSIILGMYYETEANQTGNPQVLIFC